MSSTFEDVQVVRGDISGRLDQAARDYGTVAWDIETSGLKWSIDTIGTVQLHVPNAGTEIVQMNAGEVPTRLSALLSSERVVKVFHHAPFDLRFMTHQWSVRPRNIACTKIAAKIVNPNLSSREYSLAPLLRTLLGVHINKDQRTSNWTSEQLNDSQINYAANDVKYLIPLLRELLYTARQEGVSTLVEDSFYYLPTRVQIELRGGGDVYAY
ncbi:ribonuclease D [Rhodococcus pyridinivorans]|uniref:ribonuclease D n=1 Tax=Rhodococcus pyridinivorans TaxID=103816 RepID=UPI002226961F|nr:ribonuclease D [Rhodococcus pyridinivorans]MCW3471048.1 ribonuclease D [Rhodococcus pyridinivorans]